MLWLSSEEPEEDEYVVPVAGAGWDSAVGSGEACGLTVVAVTSLPMLWLSLSGGAAVALISTETSSDEEEDATVAVGAVVVAAGGATAGVARVVAGGATGSVGANVVSGGVTGRTVGGATVEGGVATVAVCTGGAEVAGAV